ncbi:MAG: hypothetical protein P8Y30_07395 [candidate division WOR-3 bacterium]
MGNSKAPGTQNMSISSSLTSWRLRQSIAPSFNTPVTDYAFNRQPLFSPIGDKSIV